MTKASLEMFRGNTQQFDIAVTKGGVPVNIDGWTFRLTAKASLADPTAGEVFQVTNEDFTVTDAPGGLVSCIVQPAKTKDLPITSDKSYFFDVQAVEAGGAVHTVAFGKITIRMDVTDGT